MLVLPGDLCWAEVSIPRSDPLWDDDVGRSMWWLGHAWAEALKALLPQSVEVHRGRSLRTEWSTLACFAGVGSGEVLLAGRKVVGLSQRRTRDGALFQCAAAIRLRAGVMVPMLVEQPSRQAALRGALEETSWGVAEAAAEAGAQPVTLDLLRRSFLSALVDTTR